MELSALDRLEIIELQSIYAWGIDGRDSSVFARAFSDVGGRRAPIARASRSAPPEATSRASA